MRPDAKPEPNKPNADAPAQHTLFDSLNEPGG
jgi:hypothetical protein